MQAPADNTVSRSPWAAIGADDQEQLSAELGPEAGATALCVWYRLCLEAFRQNTASPAVSLRRLARETALGLRTVQRRVADLERLGFVSTAHTTAPGTGNLATTFTLNRGFYSQPPCSHNGHTLWPMMQDVIGYTFQDCIQESVKRNTPPLSTGDAPGGAARARFTPPTLDDVTAYCLERGNSVDPQRFVDHYTANGWRVGRNPMRDWKGAVRTWERNGVDTARPSARLRRAIGQTIRQEQGEITF